MLAFILKRKIKKAMKRTRLEFANCEPAIVDHFFYGAVEIHPRSLAMWYIFRTEAEMEQAGNSGMCCRIAEATARHLEQLRYPVDPRGLVSFASQEAIDNTPGGPRMYFQ